RESAVLKRLRATPLPLKTYVAASLTSTMYVFAIQTVVLFVIGRLLYNTPMPSRVGSLIVLVIIGAVAFAALGVGLASLIRSAEGSWAVVTVILLPMAFLPGSFGPTRHYPRFL